MENESDKNGGPPIAIPIYTVLRTVYTCMNMSQNHVLTAVCTYVPYYHLSCLSQGVCLRSSTHSIHLSMTCHELGSITGGKLGLFCSLSFNLVIHSEKEVKILIHACARQHTAQGSIPALIFAVIRFTSILTSLANTQGTKMEFLVIVHGVALNQGCTTVGNLEFTHTICTAFVYTLN